MSIFLLQVQGRGLPGIIRQDLVPAAQQTLEGLVFLAFLVGLALYVIPWFEEWAARGKAILVRAVVVQLLYAAATTLFGWLGALGRNL